MMPAVSSADTCLRTGRVRGRRVAGGRVRRHLEVLEVEARDLLERRRRDRATRCGRSQTPQFAIAAYAAAIWIGVTARPWPSVTFPIVDPDQYECRMPAPSPGKSTPVVRPKPIRAIHRSSRCFRSMIA